MSILLSILNGFWILFRIILVPVLCFIGLSCCLVFIYFIVFFFRGSRLLKGKHNRVKRYSFLKNLFYYFPKRYVNDLYSRDPEMFKHQGCIIFTGRQGNGKTISMVEQCMLWQREYPKAKTITNLAFQYQDDELSRWEQLIDYKNGKYGVICLIDKTQNWFSSNQSKNFPPEMLEVITQNRKNRRVILGTAQSFNRLAKPIREQATEVRRCTTVLGCVTFVHRVVPELDSTGEVVKWKHKGFYYFVHTDELRNSYDTYKVIESLRNSGFQDRSFPVKEN